jgi:hypothetical protein
VTLKPKEGQPTKIVVKDAANAPIIYFDGAPNFGNNNGVVNVTLAAARHMSDGDQITTDVVATAFIRCSVPAAIALRDAINAALLIGAPAPDQIN